MKNKKILFLILQISILALPIAVQAQTTLSSIVTGARTSLVGLGAGLATISFIVAGIMFLTATGNPSRMAIAKGSLIAAIIGIVIIVLAGGAESFVRTFFGITAGGPPVAP